MNWKDTIGNYVKVAQEVKLENIWSEIEFDGWVAKVADGILAMDNGEEWTVEDGEIAVRNSHLVPCVPHGMAAWIRHSEKWLRSEAGWERAAVPNKLPHCKCTSCSLYDNQLVEDKGRLEECDVLFVGEAPGYEEARSQPPSFFIGRAGRLLRALIDQTGVGKFKVSFNNTCVCYASEAPTADDIRACKGRLLDEIQLTHPKLVVAIGGVALEALTGLSGITEHQGLLMDWEGIKLLPCFHSAAVLRRPELFYSFAEAIYKAALYLKGDRNLDVKLSDFNCSTVTECPTSILEAPTGPEKGYIYFDEAMKVLNTAEQLYVDLETTGYNPYTEDIICVSVSYRINGKASRRSFVFPWELIRQHFGEFQILLEHKPSNYWNGFFDAQFLRQHNIRPNVAGDIMLKHYTLDETPLSQALKGTARRYCNASDWEEPLKPFLPTRQTSFAEVPHDVLFLYAGYDAGYTGVLDDVISERMDPHNWSVYTNILVPALQMFLDTCEVGLRVDLPRLTELREELRVKMTSLQQTLAGMVRDDYQRQLDNAQAELTKIVTARITRGGTQLDAKELELTAAVNALKGAVNSSQYFNPSSIKDARHLIYEVVGIPVNGETSSTSRSALEDYRGVEGVDKLLQFRETRKLLGTYIEGLADDLIEDVVHPNIRMNGTVTGRLSSSNPNFFGIPDEKGGIKKLYKARYDGWGIGNGDGAQMEIRVLGALSNDRQMIEDFVRGVDFHGAARNRLYGRGFSKSLYNHQEVLDAKTVVFGPIYGRGADSLAQQFYHSEIAALKAAGQSIKYPTWASLPGPERSKRIAIAQDHIDKLWEPYPTALAWLKANVARGQEDGELVSYYGRVRHWGLITDETMEDIKTQGRNFPVQSPSSDTNLLVMYGSYKFFSREVYLPIFPVHDSVVFMYKLGEEKWLIPQLKAYFEKRAQELLKTSMRFEYEFTTGPNWGEQEAWKNGS